MNEIPLDKYKEICEDFCSFAIWYAREHPCVTCSVVTRVISIRSELSTAIIKKSLNM
jgi:ribosomal protein S26